MKKLFFIAVLMMLTLALTAQDSITPEAFKITWSLVITVLAGIYEILSRIVPTNKTWSIIGKILEFLTWLSNIFDNKKQKGGKK